MYMYSITCTLYMYVVGYNTLYTVYVLVVQCTVHVYTHYIVTSACCLNHNYVGSHCECSILFMWDASSVKVCHIAACRQTISDSIGVGHC